MFKKVLKGLVIGSAALTMFASAATAADTVEVNIFGASAQFKFWTSAAPEFLKATTENGGMGCAADDVYAATNETQEEADTHDRDAGIAVCAGVDAFAGVTGAGYNTNGDTLIIRYTTNASYDGVMSVQDNDDFIDSDDAAACTNAGDRLMAAPVTGELGSWDAPGDSIATLACGNVNVGASDVSAKTFKQESDGWSKGPNGDNSSVIDRKIHYPDTVTVDPADAGYQVDNPIVVPFGFFANNDPTTPVPVDNISRLMTVNIFTGQYPNWNNVDPSYGDIPMIVCHRHAGSGTVATFNAAVLRGVATMPVKQQDGDRASDYYNRSVSRGNAPAIYFNKGSSDAAKCAGKHLGAIAYADSDKCVGGCSDKYGKVKAIAYQGVGGDLNTDKMSDAIKYGRHIFWAAQYLYSNETPDGPVDTVIDALAAYALKDANMPSNRADFWAAQEAMEWSKDTDFAWPVYSGN